MIAMMVPMILMILGAEDPDDPADPQTWNYAQRLSIGVLLYLTDYIRSQARRTVGRDYVETLEHYALVGILIIVSKAI